MADKKIAQAKKKRAPGAGRPIGPRMPCGWACGASLTSREMRAHFTDCPNRPDITRIKLDREESAAFGKLLLDDSGPSKKAIAAIRKARSYPTR